MYSSFYYLKDHNRNHDHVFNKKFFFSFKFQDNMSWKSLVEHWNNEKKSTDEL